jgi:hypothetical protein
MFIYRDKKTNKKVKSERPLKSPDLVLIREFKNGMIKSNKVSKK